MNIRETGLEGILYQRLESIKQEARIEIVPFPLIFHRLCSAFQITRKAGWDLLYYLQNKGMIKIVPFHGVKILISSNQTFNKALMVETNSLA